VRVVLGIIHAADLSIWIPVHSAHGNLFVIKNPKALLIPSLWLLGFLTSFYILPLPDIFQTSAAITVLLMAVGVVFVSLPPPQIKISPLTWLVTALWCVAGISVMGSDVKFVSLIYFFFWSAFPLCFFLFSMADETIVLRIIRWGLLALGVAALVQFFAMPQMLKFGGTHWPFADNNSLGALLAVGVLMFFSEALRGGKEQKLNIAASLVMFAALVTTEGRAIMLAFAVTFFLFIILAGRGHGKAIGLFLIGVVIVLCTFKQSDLSVYHWFDDGAKTLSSFATASANEPNKLTGSRLMMWESAAVMIKNHPVTGTGIGTFFLYYPEFRNPLDDSAGFMAHNDLIQFGVEMGGIAPVIAIFMVMFVFLTTIKKVRSAVSDVEKLNVLMPCVLFLMVCLHSLSNFNFYILPTLMIAGVMLAAWNKQIASSVYSVDRKIYRDGVLVFGAVFLFIPLWMVSVSEYQSQNAIVKLQANDIEGFSDSLNLAETLSAGTNGRVYLNAAMFAIATEDKDRALIMLDKAERVNPRVPQIYVERSKLSTDKESAMDEARVAFRIDPTFVPARMRLADMLEEDGQGKEAYEILKGGMVGKMRFPSPQTYYLRVIKDAKKFGDKATADLAAERFAP
jgi:O-antigen ligase